MNLLEIFLIAIGLSMDAFAVSVTLGLSVKKITFKEALLPGIYFGSFQALMPALGYFTGIYFADKIEEFDHWFAFVLLGFIGGKMIKDSFSKEEKTSFENSFGFLRMLVLAAATSIDALAVGVTFALLGVNIYRAALITGVTTFFISISGVLIAGIFGAVLRSKAELAGGIVLVMIGIKIVIEHIFF
ncbi:MAG: manganese efflux pump MntP family protein [Spirochaetaceae bacterium]|jgi:putative Mn2+ efflux pump MntP|nr:manganese efflux pump MntP family protein [Spirochaetaceae bacterium]